MKSPASSRPTTAAAVSFSRAIKLLSLASICSLVVAANATGQGQTLVEYDPVGGPHMSAAPFPPTSVAPIVGASPVSQTGFVGAWQNTNVWPVGQIGTSSPVLDPNQYVTFDVTPNMTTIQYLTLSYSKRSYVGEGPQQAAVRTSLDGFASDVDSVAGLDPAGVDQIVFDISSVASAGPITFRVYFFDAPVAGADWVDLDSSANGGTGLVLTGSDLGGAVGTNYCGPAIPNSTGFGGAISGDGSALVAANDLTLTADQLPPAQFGYFLVGQTQGFFNPPGSSGFICLSGAIGRYNGNVGMGPSFSLTLDLTAVPQPTGTIAVQPGETWNFQAWYRDVGNTNNFTDGLEVQFQ